MTDVQTVKKGTVSWKPAARLIAKVPPGYRGRWCDKDPGNLAKKQAEGWVIASSITGPKAEHQATGMVQDGKPLTSVTEYRESVLMLIPEEVAQARAEYYENVTRQQTVGIKRRAESEDERNANSAGAKPKGVRGSIHID